MATRHAVPGPAASELWPALSACELLTGSRLLVNGFAVPAE
jgi:hypothetical protein